MSILHIRDENGNFIPIPTIKGKDGKSAYDLAKEGGYQGTKEEFIQILGSLGGINALQLDNITAEQIGALADTGGTLRGDLNIYGEHYPTLKVGLDDSNTLSLFYTQNKTVDIYNWTSGEPTTISLGNVNSMLLRDVCKLWVGAKDYQIYGDHNAAELGIAKVATGSYVGTGTGGANNPSTLTFPFTPKVVFISLADMEANRCDATLPLVYGSKFGLVYTATSSNWTSHSTVPLNLVWSDNTLFWSYTLNTTSPEQRQLNISNETYNWFAIG